MTMRSPFLAMLWEQWRLTRVEALVRVALGVVVGSTLILLSREGAAVAFWILIWTNAIIWLSISKLNGGKFVDGYKPGFPLYLLYARPVPTASIVGLAVVYDALSGAVLYVLSAAIVGFVFDMPFPLFSVVPWIIASRCLYTCVQWSTHNRFVQWGVSLAVYWPLFFFLKTRVTTPLQVGFTLAQNAVLLSMALVAIGLTIAGVARQRRGDVAESAPAKSVPGGYPEWLISLLRPPCPASSATRAQVWFELRSSGLPILMIALAVALAAFVLFAMSIPFAPVRTAAVAVSLFAGPVMIATMGGNAFGIRRKQGRLFVSAFEATQPCGTARLAGIKLLVRWGCLMVALLVVAVTVWASSPLVSAWGPWTPDGTHDAAVGLLKTRVNIHDAFGNFTGYALAARTVIVGIAVAILVVARAALTALRARYSRRFFIASALLLLYALALLALALATGRGMASAVLLHTTLVVTGWLLLAVTVVTTLYLLARGFAERALTARYACFAVLIAAVFAAAWRAEAPATPPIVMLALACLPLMAGFLAPWSLNRIRHA